ncbi:S02 protein [Pseudomonas syringae pv. spinaceae]|nr:S02 protein [Pseudomonas syringae pv. spinaceae]
MAVFVRLKPKTSLHGDARFANDRELRQFEYQGEYKNTSKARK